MSSTEVKLAAIGPATAQQKYREIIASLMSPM